MTSAWVARRSRIQADSVLDPFTSHRAGISGKPLSRCCARSLACLCCCCCLALALTLARGVQGREFCAPNVHGGPCIINYPNRGRLPRTSRGHQGRRQEINERRTPTHAATAHSTLSATPTPLCTVRIFVFPRRQLLIHQPSSQRRYRCRLRPFPCSSLACARLMPDLSGCLFESTLLLIRREACFS